MADQWTRTTGLVAILGGVLTVIVNVPSDWYGAGPRDSYLFDPAVFSPLWIHRVLVPALSVLAGLGLLVGLLGLIRRDWSRSGRSRRWGGVLGIIGLAMVTLTIPVIVPTSTSTGDAVLFTLVALLTLVLGLLVLGLGLLLLAYGYSQTTRPRLGYAFIGVIVGIPAFNVISPDVLGSLLAMTPVGVVWILIGLELIDHPDPLERERSDSSAE